MALGRRALGDEVVGVAAGATRREALGHLAKNLVATRRGELHGRPHPPADIIRAVRAHAPQGLRALPRLVVVHWARRGLLLLDDGERARERRAAPGLVVRDAHVDVARGADVEPVPLEAQDVHARADRVDHFFFEKKAKLFLERPNELAKNLFPKKKTKTNQK